MKISILIPYRPEDGSKREHHWRIESFKKTVEFWNSIEGYDIEVVTSDSIADRFNRSEARNNAFVKSTGDILVIADADTIVPHKSFKEAVERVSSGELAWAIPYIHYYNLSVDFTKILLESEGVLPQPSDLTHPASYEHKVLSYAGCLVLPREAYDVVGGYDEDFKGWGYEDNAFRLALDNEWGVHTRVDGAAWHLWHPIYERDRFTFNNVKDNYLIYKNRYERKYGHVDERVVRH